MKILLSLCLSAAFAATVMAIPQTITSPTVLLNGRNVEQFASTPASWSPNAGLPGPWSAPAADGTQTLTDKTSVFGIPAAEVQATRSSDRLTRMRVVFRDSGKDRHTLLTRVSQGIAAFTGHPAREEGHDAKVFHYEKTQIRATSGHEGEVVVDFTPAP